MPQDQDPQLQQQDPQVAPEPQATEPVTEPVTEEPEYDIDGERVPSELVRQWRDSHENRGKWERSLKQKDMQYAQVRQHLEAAFGKRFGEFTGNDLADLQAFGIFNHRLRTDAPFRERWHKALVAAEEQKGATPQEAQAKATETIQKATQAPDGKPGDAAAQAATLPPQTLKELAEMRAMLGELRQQTQAQQQYQMQQTLGALESHIDGRIADSTRRHAADLADASGEIRERVLYSLLQYDDAELLELARSGELAGLIDQATKDATGRIKGYVERSLKARVPATKDAKKAAPTAPFKGQPAPAAKEEPASLAAMHARLMKEFPQT